MSDGRTEQVRQPEYPSHRLNTKLRRSRLQPLHLHGLVLRKVCLITELAFELVEPDVRPTSSSVTPLGFDLQKAAWSACHIPRLSLRGPWLVSASVSLF